jgi:hypothetical protein
MLGKHLILIGKKTPGFSGDWKGLTFTEIGFIPYFCKGEHIKIIIIVVIVRELAF